MLDFEYMGVATLFSCLSNAIASGWVGGWVGTMTLSHNFFLGGGQTSH